MILFDVLDILSSESSVNICFCRWNRTSAHRSMTCSVFFPPFQSIKSNYLDYHCRSRHADRTIAAHLDGHLLSLSLCLQRHLYLRWSIMINKHGRWVWLHHQSKRGQVTDRHPTNDYWMNKKWQLLLSTDPETGFFSLSLALSLSPQSWEVYSFVDLHFLNENVWHLRTSTIITCPIFVRYGIHRWNAITTDHCPTFNQWWFDHHQSIKYHSITKFSFTSL